MASNGVYSNNALYPTSVETWDDYDASSTGNNWDSIANWQGTPSLPLTYTTAVIDFGRKDLAVPLTTLVKDGSVSTTIYYGDSVDSTGGSIDTPTSITVNPGDSVSAINARYFQFEFNVTYNDSAGAENTPAFYSIETNLTTVKEQEVFSDVDSSTLDGSVGLRQLNLKKPITPTAVVVTPHGFSTDSAGVPIQPIVAVDKGTTPIVLNIIDANTFDRTAIDVSFDALVEGLPNATCDDNGNIVRG